MAQNAGHIAQPCRRGLSLRTVCGDSDPCAVFELSHLEPPFFPHPCAETPTRAETPNRAETRILTVLVLLEALLLILLLAEMDIHALRQCVRSVCRSQTKVSFGTPLLHMIQQEVESSSSTK